MEKTEEHTKILKQLNNRTEFMNAYLLAVKHRGHQFIEDAKEELGKRFGEPVELVDYLQTKKGSEEYANIASEKIQNYVLTDLKINKNKFETSELERITTMMYKVNKDNLSKFVLINNGQIDSEKYNTQFLNEHLESLEKQIVTKYILDYDSTHNPAILNHLTEGRFDEFFKKELVEDIKTNKMKHVVWNAYKHSDNGKNPIGYDFFKSNPQTTFFMNEYKQ